MSVRRPHAYASGVLELSSKRAPDRKKSSVSSIKGEIRIGDKTDVQFESSHEKSFLEVCSVERKVYSIKSQPVTLQFTDLIASSIREYTPDFLIEFDSSIPSTWGLSTRYFQRTVLIEVKPFERLMKDRRILLPKFSAAQIWCERKGYEFQVITDRGLKYDWIRNAQLILRAKSMPKNTALRRKILDLLDGGFGFSISALNSHERIRDYAISEVSVAVLQLIASGTLSARLLDSFDNESIVTYEP